MPAKIFRLRSSSRLLNLVLLVTLWFSLAHPAQARQTAPDPQQQAQALLERLTPEERVGQLFLITFQGTDTSSESPIYDLVTNYHIGGVILLAANDNIGDPEQGVLQVDRQVFSLNRQLQQIAWNASRQAQTNPVDGQTFTPAYMPLFIGVSQEGGGDPYDQILSGLTPLPNQMALGATWKPDLAEQIGGILGKELSALGFNLLLGPSLDVLDTPQLGSTNNLGTRTFGGDPYWVSEMGRAYIRGVHQGSAGKIAVIAKRFPGHGSADRLPEEEVSTVRKSLQQLETFDLVPFFAVTGNAATPEETSDGLLASHIRYQGLQGNIRATTRPVSLDPQAFNLLMSLSTLDTWRQRGGLMISDNLGSRAVRRFYDLTSQTFEARRVALNAFLAGNDLLYIGDFSSASEPDSYTAAVRTFEFFAQKYRDDTAFAQRVDASVLRILTLKYRLYANFTLGSVVAPQTSLEEIGTSSKVVFEVARQAATLLSPSQTELDDSIPDPPNQDDRIVFISDTRTALQCSQCQPYSLLETRALQDAVTRLYGPSSGGQISPGNLSSYSLNDLQIMLDGSLPDAPLESELKRANWIVFGMLAPRSDWPSFQILSRFLSERPDLFQQKRLIVFAFCAPYFLDATNISKLNAYYGLYGKTPQFIDVAAYLLFRELRPIGSSPVSVSGIRYDLNSALFPDPDQIIPLELDLPQPELLPTPATPEPTPSPEFHLGDVIPLRTGVILDSNGHAVPDGTPVSFVFVQGSETNSTRQDATTKKGIARTTFSINLPGALEIHVESENARSASLKFEIPSPSGEVLDTPTPTLEPTLTPVPPSPTPIPVEPTPEPPLQPPPTRPGFGDWLLAVFVSALVSWLGYRLAALIGKNIWGIRAAFLAFIGGLLAYSYLALEMPGTQALLKSSISFGTFLGTLIGAALGLIAAIAWQFAADRSRQKATE
ncbi:MAG: glycoside hydrolase family 3 N-terminal domain-containing protein [Chloroflexota bacterium]